MLLNTERIKQYMDAEGLDGLVASTLENVFYLSGVWQLGQELFPHDAEGYVVATREAPDAGTMVIGVGEADMALESYPTVTRAVTYGTFWREMPPRYSSTVAAPRRNGISSHGIVASPRSADGSFGSAFTAASISRVASS